MPECLDCGGELNSHDSFGTYLGRNEWDFIGDIYKCINEDCESGVHNFYFYSYRNNNELHRGYPC